MKRLIIPLVVWLTASEVCGQQPAKEIIPASLALELVEYEAKRKEGVGRLADEATTQLGVVLKTQMSEGKLEAANAINKAIASLPITTHEKANLPDGLPAAAVSVLKEHAQKTFAGIHGLNQLYIPKLEKVKVELLKSGDLAGANLTEAKIRGLREEAETLVPVKIPSGKQEEIADSFTVEALIDGGTQLHVTKEGIYWMVPGGEAKPGLHEGSKEATYVNGSRWKPVWRLAGTRGPDTCEVYPIKTTSPKLVAETVLVSKERFGRNEQRTPIQTSVKDDHLVVTIRDPEGGSRWYKIRIKSVP